MRQDVGQSCHNAVAEACRLPPTHGTPTDADDVIRHLMGPLPRPLLPITFEAESRGMDPRTWKERVLVSSSAAYFGSRAWISSVLSHLWNLCGTGPNHDFEAFSTASWVSYDETPLCFRSEDFANARGFPDLSRAQQEVLGVNHGPADPAPSGKAEKQTCKVIQSDGCLSISLRRKSDDSFVIIEFQQVSGQAREPRTGIPKALILWVSGISFSFHPGSSHLMSSESSSHPLIL